MCSEDCGTVIIFELNLKKLTDKLPAHGHRKISDLFLGCNKRKINLKMNAHTHERATGGFPMDICEFYAH